MISPDDVANSVAALRAALNAKTSVRLGGGRYGLIEDWRSRIVAAKLLIEFKHGKAAQRIESKSQVAHIHTTPEEVLRLAGSRFGATERIVREYLAGDDAHTVDLPQPAVPEPVVVDVDV